MGMNSIGFSRLIPTPTHFLLSNSRIGLTNQTESVIRLYCKPSTSVSSLGLGLHEKKIKEDEVRTRRFIIDSQVSLRKDVQKQGDQFAEKLWQLRMQDKKHLDLYAANMLELSTNIWNRYKKMNLRISWTHDNIMNYYDRKIASYLKEEKRIFQFFPELRKDFNKSVEFYDLEVGRRPTIDEPLQVLDVGSCYNPFSIYDYFNVTAIDICPARPDVNKCDFLKIKLNNKEDYSNISHSKKMSSNLAENYCLEDKNNLKGSISTLSSCIGGGKCDNGRIADSCNTLDVSETRKDRPYAKIDSLYKESFHAVIFCLFIGYIPSPRLRHLCCQKAYDLLTTNGLLCIITPVSSYSHINAHFADLWKLTLGHMGFHCIKYKELKHFHGLIFRKGVSKELFQNEAERELEELISRNQSFDNEKLKMFKNFNYKSIFKNFYIHQDLLGLKDKVS